MEDHEIKPIIEALLFISVEPISMDRFKEILTGVEKSLMLEKLLSLQQEYAQSNRGIQIVEVAGGYQMTTRAEMSPWIRELEKIKTSSRLSQPSLETLAIIAYKQPLTRAEIEAIRGVDAAGVLKTLMDRRLVKIVGRKEVAGRPLIYGTTREFLMYFGLANLTALPTLKEFTDIAEREAEPDVEQEEISNESLLMVGANNHNEEEI
jgi:segregation and condensation protein B